MANATEKFISFGEATNFTTKMFKPLNILDIFNLVFNLPAHSYIIWLIVKGTNSGLASGFFNLNLSVCEICNCLNSLLSLFEISFTTVTTFIHFIVGLGLTGRSLFQCLICVERYLAVVHPVTFLKLKPLRYRVICCAVVWIISFASCFCCMYTINQFYIYVYIFSLQYIFFFSVQLFCLVAVLRALKQSGPGDRRREEENHMKRRAFYLILISFISMTIIFVPFTISGLFYILTNKYLEELFEVGLFCFILPGVVHPVLYLNRVGKLSLKCIWFQ